MWRLSFDRLPHSYLLLFSIYNPILLNQCSHLNACDLHESIHMIYFVY